MKSRICLSLLVGVVAVGFAGGLPAQDEGTTDKVTIKWKYEKGQVLRYEFTQEMDMDMGGMEMEQDMLFGMTQKVASVDDKGIATLRVTYDRIKIKMAGTGGMMDSEYDSDEDEEPADDDSMARLFSALLGESFTMKVDAKGNVKEVTGYAEMMEKAMENLDEGDMMGEMLKSQYTDDQIKSQLQWSMPYLPKGSVSVGDSWKAKNTMPIPSMGKLTMKSKSTLKKIKDDGNTAVIKQTTDMALADEEDQDKDKEDEEDPFGGMVEITEAGSKATIEWDLENGRLAKMDTDMKWVMEAAGQEFEMSFTMKMVYAPKKSKGKDVPSEDKKDKKKKDKDDYK